MNPNKIILVEVVSYVILYVLALALTVTNYFVLKGVTSPGIRFLAFLPLIVSVTHVVYTFFFT